MRVKFHSGNGNPYFGVEARYGHPKEDVLGDADVLRATDYLKGNGFSVHNDGYAHCWARTAPVDEVLDGAQTLDRMLDHIRGAVTQLFASGIFPALAARQPTTPPITPPPEDTEADS